MMQHVTCQHMVVKAALSLQIAPDADAPDWIAPQVHVSAQQVPQDR